MQSAPRFLILNATTTTGVRLSQEFVNASASSDNSPATERSITFEHEHGILSPRSDYCYAVLGGTLHFAGAPNPSGSTAIDAICKVEFERRWNERYSDSDDDSDNYDDDSDDYDSDSDSDATYEKANRHSALAPPRLRKEAGFYEDQLRDLQGHVVPRLYGYFESTPEARSRDAGNEESIDSSGTPRLRKIVACLILEDCGKALGDDMLNMHPFIRDRIVEAMKAIHRSGLCMPTYSHRTSVVKNDAGDIRIVGFSRAREHKCTVTGAFDRYSLDVEGNWSIFGCEELYRIALFLKWLTPGVLRVAGQSIRLATYSTITDMKRKFIPPPPRDDAKGFKLHQHFQMLYDRELHELEDTIRQYLDKYGQRDPAVVLRHHPEVAARKAWPPTIQPASDPGPETASPSSLSQPEEPVLVRASSTDSPVA